MALTDHKISPADVSAVHIEAQPDILQDSAQMNKRKFDAYSDMIVSHFNDFVDDVSSAVGTTIDGSVLALYASLGWLPTE